MTEAHQFSSRAALVVGIDGSMAATYALDWTLDAAARRGATVTVVRAWSGIEAKSADDDSPFSLAADERARLDAGVDEAVRPGDCSVQIERRLVEGAPAAALLRVAKARDADLLVVGRRGLGQISGLCLGSVSHRCVSLADRTVVVVPPAHRVGVFRRIAVGVDDSAEAVEAVSWAADEATLWSATLVVVHVYPEAGLSASFDGYSEAASVADRVIEKALAQSMSRPPIERLALHGRPSTELLGQSTRADLLVVGASPRPGPGPLGSVAGPCLEHAMSPVVVVRPK